MIPFWVFRYGFLSSILEVVSYGKLKIISQSSNEHFLLKLQELHSEMKNHFISKNQSHSKIRSKGTDYKRCFVTLMPTERELHLLKYLVLQMIFIKMYSFLMFKYKI